MNWAREAVSTDLNHPGVGRANVINRLRQCEVVDIIVNQTAAKTIERTDGLLLFIEEIAKAVLEAKSAGSQTMSAVALSPRGGGSPQLMLNRCRRRDR